MGDISGKLSVLSFHYLMTHITSNKTPNRAYLHSCTTWTCARLFFQNPAPLHFQNTRVHLEVAEKKTLDFSKQQQKNPLKNLQKICHFPPDEFHLSIEGVFAPTHLVRWLGVGTDTGELTRWVFAEAHLPWVAQSRKAVEPVKSSGCWAELHRKSTYHIICP